MYPDKEQAWTDRLPDEEADEREPTYRDGSVQHECWSDKVYTCGETEDREDE